MLRQPRPAVASCSGSWCGAMALPPLPLHSQEAPTRPRRSGTLRPPTSRATSTWPGRPQVALGRGRPLAMAFAPRPGSRGADPGSRRRHGRCSRAGRPAPSPGPATRGSVHEPYGANGRAVRAVLHHGLGRIRPPRAGLAGGPVPHTAGQRRGAGRGRGGHRLEETVATCLRRGSGILAPGPASGGCRPAGSTAGTVPGVGSMRHGLRWLPHPNIDAVRSTARGRPRPDAVCTAEGLVTLRCPGLRN